VGVVEPAARSWQCDNNLEPFDWLRKGRWSRPGSFKIRLACAPKDLLNLNGLCGSLPTGLGVRIGSYLQENPGDHGLRVVTAEAWSFGQKARAYQPGARFQRLLLLRPDTAPACLQSQWLIRVGTGRVIE